MSAPGPIMGDAVVPAAPAPIRITSRARAAGADPASELAAAQEQARSADRDLEFLACELGDALAESERRRAEISAARETCGGLSERIDAIERVARAAAQRLAEQRRVHELVAGQLAQERRQVALLVERLAAERAEADERLREARAEMALPHDMGPVPETPTLREGRLAAELEHLRRERAEHEDRLRAQLDQAMAERLELRTRLSICEHALREREHELARERQLADDAMRWASSVERELVLGGSSPAGAPDPGDCAVKPAAEAPTAPVRRRTARVRLRPAG